jgi:hypothetical protein
MQQEMYEICQDAIAKTGYFHSGKYLRSTGLRDERYALNSHRNIVAKTNPRDFFVLRSRSAQNINPLFNFVFIIGRVFSENIIP